MGTIKDESENYKPKSSVLNICELSAVDVNSVIFEETNTQFPYKYIEDNGQRYRITQSILSNLQAILKANPNLKKFKVSRQGKGMDTRYIVIPLG